jgi:hypothetical protein
MPPVGFEPTISADERPQTLSLPVLLQFHVETNACPLPQYLHSELMPVTGS